MKTYPSFWCLIFILKNNFSALSPQKALQEKEVSAVEQITATAETSVTRYIDVITMNFSQKMPNYTTKHPVA